MSQQMKKEASSIPKISIVDGVTQPVFDYSQCIFEKVFVETPLDTAEEGKRDLIAVYIRRPLETTKGMKVPAIFVANPYMMECNEDWYDLCDVDKDLNIYKTQNIKKEDVMIRHLEDQEAGKTFDFSEKTLPPERIPAGIVETAETEEIPLECISEWYGYFNSRGYASVFSGGLGTRGSEGFNCSGSQEETTAFVAVIEWLNGLRKAYTNKEDNIEIKAQWCTGSVAMSGKSYLGTMCIAAATSGACGLKTIIPEAAISNWYRYFRQNGLTVPCEGWQGDDIHLLTRYCFSRKLDPEDYSKVKNVYEKRLDCILEKADRESGNYNTFWDARNYLNNVDKIKASVFIVGGINDWNVKLDQSVLFWEELEKHNVPRKMILHQGDHIYIYDQQSIDFNGIMHRWLDYWLYGIENGVMDQIPNVLVQSNKDQDLWMESQTWPPESMRRAEFKLENEAAEFTDDLSLTGFDREKKNLIDWRSAVVSFPIEQKPFRLTFALETMKKDTRISGTVRVNLKASLDRETGILSAMLVDYGADFRLLTEKETVMKGGIQLGKNAGEIDSVRFAKEREPSPYHVISRGWMNVQNRTCSYSKEEVKLGEIYAFTFEMIPTDYTVKEGHMLGLILYGTDAEYTQRPYIATHYKVKEGSISLEIPLMNDYQNNNRS